MNSQIYSHWKQLVVKVIKTEDQQFNETLAIGIKKGNMINIHRRNETLFSSWCW